MSNNSNKRPPTTKDPVPYICAEPLPSNIVEWHYVVWGPEITPCEGGYYHGKIIFPKEFLFKPLSICMITPNGRFKCSTRLGLSITDFHLNTWNLAWPVPTIFMGCLSFMVEKNPTLGSTETSEFTKTTHEQLIHQYEPPQQIQSDQGTHFGGHNVQDWPQGLVTDWIFHTAYHPQANGLIERMNGMLKEQLRKLTSTKTLQHWSSHLITAGFFVKQLEYS
uniref:Integrase catalytic domain-containing protein n=1 Tax=Buteo japonicus TaxID=224669 RepID=A0A8C0HG86_9AVES